MYFCCTRKSEVITTGRGKNKSEMKCANLPEALKVAKEHSIKIQGYIDIYYGSENTHNIEKDRKVAAYKNGKNIYFNIR